MNDKKENEKQDKADPMATPSTVYDHMSEERPPVGYVPPTKTDEPDYKHI